MNSDPSARAMQPDVADLPALASLPAVAAIVTAGDRWSDTEAALRTLAAQDYTRLAVLVLCDAERPQGRRVREVLPTAAVANRVSSSSHLRRGSHRHRSGALNNRGASLVRGADYLLFLTDHVALAPDAISVLIEDVESAEDASGRVVGVAGPKLLDADDGMTLCDLGGTADRLGVRIPIANQGELDQAQHDGARDVFVAPTEAMLVREDVFRMVGGFDAHLDGDGAAVDLCWRIHLAGSRVRVVPTATGLLRSGPPRAAHGPSVRQHEHRARLRTVLKCYGWVYLLPTVVLAAFLALGEMLFAALRGRFAQASDVVLAWAWNARQLPGTFSLRGAAKRCRRVRDADLRRMQQGGSVRVADWFRYRLSPEGGLAARTTIDESILGTWRRNAHRTVWVVWALVLGGIFFGSRGLLIGGIPAYGQFARFADASTMLGAYLEGWRDNAVGDAGIGHPAMGLLGIGGFIVLGAVGLLRHIAVWGLLVVGLVGMWKLCASTASRNGRLYALALYASCPLPYNALASGRWDVLLAYGVAPSVVLCVSRLMGASEVGPSGDGHRRATSARVASLGLLLAVAAAFEPSVVLLGAAAAVVLAAAETLRRSVSRSSPGTPALGLLLVVGAAALAVLAHVPWMLEFDSLVDYLEVSLGSPTASAPDSLGELLRFQTGPLGESALGWGMLAAAAVPLLVARARRLWWAVRAWLVGLAGFAGAWAVTAGWTDGLWAGAPLGDSLAEISLVLGAVGLCWAAAVGPTSLAASDGDTSQRARGSMVLISGIAVGAMVLPTAWAALDGNWSAPTFDHRVPLGLVDDRDVGPDYRVLWLGAPEVLPLRGWDLGMDGLAAGTSVRGYPDVRHQWATPGTTGNERLLAAVRVGLAGDTLRMGRLLGSFGIRYVVVVERSGPSYSAGIERPIAPETAEALASQIDLRPLAVDPSVQVFRNEAWWSTRAQFSQPIGPGFAIDQTDLVVSDLSDGIGVLTDYRSSTSQIGSVGTGPLLVADTYDPGWRLRIAESRISPTLAQGWAMRFDPPHAGQAELSYERSAAVTNRLWAQVLIWLAIVWVAIGQPAPLADRLMAAVRGLGRRGVSGGTAVDTWDGPEGDQGIEAAQRLRRQGGGPVRTGRQ
ncbi:glycosyltransferase family 2 protein [Candidatus Poriferisodalis sp.]|uniref:glycosyltransferase family 2 protein n=1 Tax=Candidatus Poriferisodalis sp. TaxID=3101277 RepID=UPI003B026EEE